MNQLKSDQALRSIPVYVLFLLGASGSLIAQEDVYVKVAKFSILVEASGDEINLSCSDGCAWKQLSFSASIKGVPQAVDQYGMTTSTGDPDKKESLRSNFLFTIQRTPEGISLEGKDGTIWTSLTFDYAGGRCLRAIDGWGMADLKKD